MSRQHHSIRDTRRAWLAGIAALALFPLTRTAHATTASAEGRRHPVRSRVTAPITVRTAAGRSR